MITLIQTVKSRQKVLCVGALGVALSSMVAQADEPPLTMLTNQTYALCAGAISFVFNQVAYANCEISLGRALV